ncbi:MAG: hypothetical protein A2293_12825 [Elusimicrobia bacterium RIFOXYB2_FULL_49_7]|nr:MAG: hypothetical protein A2293_12825 [Elusimicrobia bacterium RIFOXYB2_FULL_49_7]
MPKRIAGFRKNRRMMWAALIKMVYEVDPLICPKCGGTMKIISFYVLQGLRVFSENVLAELCLFS